MIKRREDALAQSARRAVLIDGTPVAVLGGLVLVLGSDPNQSGSATVAWLVLGTAFALSIAWVLYRAFRRADEYQRKIQLESMAIAFGATLIGIHVASLLYAADIGDLKQHIQIVFIGGVALWLLLADIRTRFQR